MGNGSNSMVLVRYCGSWMGPMIRISAWDYHHCVPWGRRGSLNLNIHIIPDMVMLWLTRRLQCQHIPFQSNGNSLAFLLSLCHFVQNGQNTNPIFVKMQHSPQLPTINLPQYLPVSVPQPMPISYHNGHRSDEYIGLLDRRHPTPIMGRKWYQNDTDFSPIFDQFSTLQKKWATCPLFLQFFPPKARFELSLNPYQSLQYVMK